MVHADWGGQGGSRLGLDLGGTLAKLIFFESEVRPSWCSGRISAAFREIEEDSDGEGSVVRSPLQDSPFWTKKDGNLSFFDDELGGRFHFLTFRSDHMERFVQLAREHNLNSDVRRIFTAGGGAHKYSKLFQDSLGIELVPVDELSVVVKGITWLADRPLQDAFFVLSGEEKDLPKAPSSSPARYTARYLEPRGAAALFPFILVNIGTGVSIVKVDGQEKFERISGSAIGGGTFWGLCELLCPDCPDFSKATLLAAEGDEARVNLHVEDIYGGDYSLSSGRTLSGSLTASFFAKGIAEKPDDAAKLCALMKMVAQNICQMAFLNAVKHGVRRIVFTGNFLRHNPVARDAIAQNMEGVSKAYSDSEPFHAIFLHHEGYFGALGTFLHNIEAHPCRPPLSSKLARTESPPPSPWLKPVALGGEPVSIISEVEPSEPQKRWRPDLFSFALGAVLASLAYAVGGEIRPPCRSAWLW
mmetsp:Transcript_19347/g.42213  ORF Transcript_19347/g.42213 Transcript_19347/m.42213 type:complete len:472 (-) Transcript_19347:61-1476(-)